MLFDSPERERSSPGDSQDGLMTRFYNTWTGSGGKYKNSQGEEYGVYDASAALHPHIEIITTTSSTGNNSYPNNQQQNIRGAVGWRKIIPFNFDQQFVTKDFYKAMHLLYEDMKCIALRQGCYHVLEAELWELKRQIGRLDKGNKSLDEDEINKKWKNKDMSRSMTNIAVSNNSENKLSASMSSSTERRIEVPDFDGGSFIDEKVVNNNRSIGILSLLMDILNSKHFG